MQSFSIIRYLRRLAAARKESLPYTLMLGHIGRPIGRTWVQRATSRLFVTVDVARERRSHVRVSEQFLKQGDVLKSLMRALARVARLYRNGATKRATSCTSMCSGFPTRSATRTARLIAMRKRGGSDCSSTQAASVIVKHPQCAHSISCMVVLAIFAPNAAR